MDLQKKLKVALNENRLLMLGAQVLFGFQFNGVFQDRFETLPYQSRWLEASGLTLLVAFVASTQTTTWFASVLVEVCFFLVAAFSWFVLAFLIQRKKTNMPKSKTKTTPLDAQVDQLLTEARVIIPGAQALFGFQLAVTLTQAFADLPSGMKHIHLAALCGVGLAVILLMAPASLHRIAYGGEDDPQFVRIASWFVIAAPLPLALGITLDTFVAAKHFHEQIPQIGFYRIQRRHEDPRVIIECRATQLIIVLNTCQMTCSVLNAAVLI